MNKSNREMKRDAIYDFLIECEIATEEELSLVSCLMGFNLETMEAVLYARTGYRSIEQIMEEWED